MIQRGATGKVTIPIPAAIRRIAESAGELVCFRGCEPSSVKHSAGLAGRAPVERKASLGPRFAIIGRLIEKTVVRVKSLIWLRFL